MQNRMKKNAIGGLFWSGLETISIQAVSLLVQIILARLLSPKDFGIIGMITIFIVIAQMLLDGGFQNALIREKSISDKEYSTVFLFNFFMSIVLYILLFVFAPVIASFYQTPILKEVLRVIGLNLIINSFVLVQRTKLIHEMNFKIQSKISFSASLVSGGIGIACAYLGFGVWSLVAQQITTSIVQVILYFCNHKWIPRLLFCKDTFKKFFVFGWKLTLANFAITLYENSYYMIIGRYYSTADVGYYTNAKKFNDVPINSAVQPLRKVTYPLLSKFKDDTDELKKNYRVITRYAALFSFPVMLGLATCASNLIPVVFGNKWVPSIPYFQLFCIGGMIYPITYLNMNILQVKGKTGTYLGLEIGKLFIGISLIIVILILKLDILYLVIANVCTLIINTFCCIFICSKLINYPPTKQIKDFLPSLVNASIMSLILLSIDKILAINNLSALSIKIILGVVIYIFLGLFIIKIPEMRILLKKVIILLKTRNFNKSKEVD